MAKFAIIAVDYEKHVPRNGMVEGIKSLANQTYKDFELIICHDGPKEIPYDHEINFNELGLSPHILNTESKNADWGHSSRDLAMKYAYENLPDCDYYIQFNIDNLFNENAFQVINDKISETLSQVVIFSIFHNKLGWVVQGIPPVHCNIDCMQLVAHRDVWSNIGFWYDKDMMSDGTLYQEIGSKYSYVHIPEVLGHNF